MDNVVINVSCSFKMDFDYNKIVFQNITGTLHFIRFPTERMTHFIKLVKSKGFAQLRSTVCATGGGAIKYAAEMEKVNIFLFFNQL